MEAQSTTASQGEKDLARGLWASMFRGKWLLFSTNAALHLAQAVLTLAFAYVLKQVFDAVAARSLVLLVRTGRAVSLLLAAELAIELALRVTLPAFLRRATTGVPSSTDCYERTSAPLTAVDRAGTNPCSQTT